MEYEGRYLSYEEYQSLGGTLDQASFYLLEYEVSRKIDEKTTNRLKKIDIVQIPTEVKMCEYKMIGVIEEQTKRLDESTKNISSETTDGYSVKYLTPAEIDIIIKSQNEELDGIIKEYLFGVIVNDEHILYLGV